MICKLNERHIYIQTLNVFSTISGNLVNQISVLQWLSGLIIWFTSLSHSSELSSKLYLDCSADVREKALECKLLDFPCYYGGQPA